MKKLISFITLLTVLLMSVFPVMASEAEISVFYRNDLVANFDMTLDDSVTYNMANATSISSNDPGTTISIVYNNNTVATFSVSSNEIYTEYSTTDPDTLIISGIEAGMQKGTEVTVSIFYSGKSYSNIQDGIVGQLASVLTTTTTDADGNWSVEFVPLTSSDYDIYAGASHRNYLMKTVYVMADRNSIIDIIETGTKVQVADVFGNTSTLKGIVADMSTVSGINNTRRIGEILYSLREELVDKTKIMEYIDLACLMAVMEQSKTAQSMENVLAELTSLGVTIPDYGVYTANKTPEISSAVAKRLSTSVNGGIAGITSAFTNALILGGIEGSATWADIAPFMELLNNSNYTNNVYDVSLAVVGNYYPTITDLLNVVNSVGSSGVGTGGSGGSGGGGGGSAGGGASNNNTDTDNLFGFLPEDEVVNNTQNDTSEGEKILFLDVPESHWAFHNVHYLYWQDVVSGDDTGCFYPDNNITRAEMLKMLCNTFGLEEVKTASFNDVLATDWFYGYAGAAYKAGLVEGYDGNLHPNDLLTREDMAVLVYRFAQYSGENFEASNPDFADVGSISEYAADAVGALNNVGYINGMGNGLFIPKGNSTRAQVATILYRFITR